MIDTVIKGTGNSRSIKSPMTLPATWEDARAQLVSDGWPIDLGPLNLAGLLQKGTDLNKANLLTDALCESLGLDTTATPNEAIDKLRTLISTSQSTAEGKANVAYGTYTGTGLAGIANAVELHFDFVPKKIVITGKNKEIWTDRPVLRNIDKIYASAGGTIYICPITWGEDYVRFYHTQYPVLNDASIFVYVAIG